MADRSEIPEGESDIPCISPEKLAEMRKHAVDLASTTATDLDMVERHLRIAFELVPVLGNNLANRMSFLEHLQEAERFSRSFEDLSTLIRGCRKNYESNGSIPDWKSLANKLYETMETS